MNDPTEFLDLDGVIGLAITILGDPAPIRDLGLLGSAVSRPQTTAVFLEINGIEISRARNDDVYDLVIDAAAGHLAVDAIAERLRRLAT